MKRQNKNKIKNKKLFKKRRFIRRVASFFDVHKVLKRIVALFFAACVVAVSLPVAANIYMCAYSSRYIITLEEAQKMNVDCALVLGAGVRNGSPTPLLKERLNCGVAVFNTGATNRILMSGDHGREEYDEVNAMKAYAKELDVPSDDIFMDHAGFSTYESMYRAKEVFCVKSAIVVTQKYHLYRAVYDARKLGIEAYGIDAEKLNYSLPVRLYNNSREFLARTKDVLWCIVKPYPTFLGEAVPISASGALTDDKI